MPLLNYCSKVLIRSFQSLIVSILLYRLADDLELRQQVYPHHGRSVYHGSLCLILEGWQQQTKHYLDLYQNIDTLKRFSINQIQEKPN